MRRPKFAVSEAGQIYAGQIERRFPGAKTEVLLESFDGFDAWVRIELQPELHNFHEQVLDATAELSEYFAEERGIYLTAMIVDLESSHV